MKAILDKVQKFAAEAHSGQKRKYTSEDYIVHPLRVMKLCEGYTSKLPVLAAALLHDVLEDTPVSKKQMRDFLITLMDRPQVEHTLQLVEDLTDVYIKEKYPQWNRKKRKAKEAERIEKTSADSQTVKYADIIDNCVEIVQYDSDFSRVFLNECRNILHKIPKGNGELYKRAVETVDDGLRKLHDKKS